MYWYGFITGVGVSLTVWAVARILVFKRYMRKRQQLIEQLAIPSNPFINPAGEAMNKEMWEEVRKRTVSGNAGVIIQQEKPEKEKT